MQDSLSVLALRIISAGLLAAALTGATQAMPDLDVEGHNTAPLSASGQQAFDSALSLLSIVDPLAAASVASAVNSGALTIAEENTPGGDGATDSDTMALDTEETTEITNPDGSTSEVTTHTSIAYLAVIIQHEAIHHQFGVGGGLDPCSHANAYDKTNDTLEELACELGALGLGFGHITCDEITSNYNRQITAIRQCIAAGGGPGSFIQPDPVPDLSCCLNS